MRIVFFGCFLCVFCIMATENDSRIKNGSNSDTPQSANSTSHILFVNVGNALPDETFGTVVTSITNVIPVHLEVASVSSLNIHNLIHKNAFERRWNPATKLVIYVIRDSETVSFCSVPRRWALVNIFGFDKNIVNINSDRYGERLKKLMLKGFALACGVGGNHDSNRCVMALDSFTPETIDTTSASYSPFALAPIENTLGLFHGIYLQGE